MSPAPSPRLARIHKPVSDESSSLSIERESMARSWRNPVNRTRWGGRGFVPPRRRFGASTAAGAGEGNRTLVVSLGSFCSAIELHPRRCAFYARAAGRARGAELAASRALERAARRKRVKFRHL